MAIDISGNIYVTGCSGTSLYYNTFSYDYATIKYNSLGIEQWVVRYSEYGNYDDVASAIAVDSSGNVYVTGGSIGFMIGYDYATIKYSQSTFSEIFYLY